MQRRNYHLASAIALLGGLGLTSTAQAANWFQLQGTEPSGIAAPVKVWGFLQPQYMETGGKTLSGLRGANASYNGQTPNFNLVPPQNSSSDSFSILRARIGVRGVLSPISDKINYFFLSEFGNNGYTTTGSGSTPRLIDASVTFNYIPGARVRIGTFKTPGPEEALQGILTFDYINFTNVTGQLIQEPFFTTGPTTPISPTTTPNTIPGTQTTGYIASPSGTINAFRDTGVQFFDWFRHGPWEMAYAAMLGNGAPLFTTDNNGGKDAYGRIQTSYIFGNSTGPYRHDATGWIWYQHGNRTFNGSQYSRVREGLGGQLRTGYMQANAVRVTGEYMRGTGMIPVGSAFPGVATTVYPGSNNKANGWYLESGYFATKNVELDLRYDKYNRLTNSAADERDFKTWTLGAEYHFSPAARVTLNYEFRKLGIPHKNAIVGPNPTATSIAQGNAQSVADAMDNRLSLQATLVF